MKERFIALLADDDKNDRELMRRAISRACVPIETREVHDGEEAIDYLRGKGRYEDRLAFPFPQLLILDLKMPRMDGFGVLDWLRNHPECNMLPVVMMSGSGLEKDVIEAHQRGVRAYFVKPSDFLQLQDLVRVIAEHWGRAALPELPKKCE
jgi:CheY-like chemotaxis protein